jgi:2Fe-2S ferredoxin
MATISVLNRGQSFTARDGSSVLKAASDNKAAWRQFCGGQALCATCCMLVVSGKVSEPTAIERYFIEGWGYHPEFRLACQTRALGDVAVISCMDEGYDPDAVVAAYDKAAAAPGK